MQQRFPRDEELWRRQVEQLLMGLVVDRDRIWKMTPQIPDPEAGAAFTGPLAPYHFVGPGRFGASGSPLSGSRAQSGGEVQSGGTLASGGSGSAGCSCSDITCSSYHFVGEITISGVTGPCAADFNGTFSPGLDAQDCNPRRYIEEGIPEITIDIAVTNTPTNDPIATVTMHNGSGGVSATFSGVVCPKDISAVGCPVTLVSESATNGCTGTSFADATVVINIPPS